MLCKKCKTMFPPFFVNDGLCIWCTRDKDEIEYTNADGKRIKATRKSVSEEYRKLLIDLKDKPGIDGVIKKSKEWNK